ncbi:Pullulanase [compost metagenome]
MAVQKELDYVIEYGDPETTGGLSVFSEEFDEAYAYGGDELGLRYSPEGSEFVLWAPTASEALVMLYEAWDSAEGTGYSMTREERGVWRLALPGDLAGKLYTYKVRIGSQWNEAADPYARAVSINGDRGAVLDLALTNPERWTEDKPTFDHPLDAVIYEVHIRDLTIHPLSGVQHKGTYAGACETGTVGPDGSPTGLDHIAGLGVTHVQLLPVYDYATESVDERSPLDRYNWGYDPKNYNVPEGSYSLEPYDPATRIRELKTLIQTYHDHGLRVIMDVVYNHVYDGYRANLAKLVPGYYMRHKADGSLSNGSGCGNDTASERRMMRKLIVDSVLYWAREYRMDGFRFDLMGLLDLETMNEVRTRLHGLDPSFVLLGEGWIMPTELAPERRADQANAAGLPGIGQFNDNLRDALKGSTFAEKAPGFAGGQHGFEHDVRRGIAGAVAYNEQTKGFALEPVQSVAYVEAHDNHTLWDKLALTNGHEDENRRKRRQLLASAVVMTSQGMAFLHAGQEFFRTKGGDHNSYKAPDSVNWMDWSRCAQEQEAVYYMRQLIRLRKAHPAFRLRTAEEIRASLVFEQSVDGCIAYTLRNHANHDPCRDLFVVHNANTHPVTVDIPLPGVWSVLFGLGNHGSFDRLRGGRLDVHGVSSVVLGVVSQTGFYPA